MSTNLAWKDIEDHIIRDSFEFGGDNPISYSVFRDKLVQAMEPYVRMYTLVQNKLPSDIQQAFSYIINSQHTEELRSLGFFHPLQTILDDWQDAITQEILKKNEEN